MGDKDTLESIKAWNGQAETFTKSASEGLKKLSEAKKVVEAAENLEKLSGALGAAGVGLDIVLSFFSSGPSDTELILNAIQDLSDKVSNLWTAMDVKLDQVMFGDNWNAAQEQFIAPVGKLDELRTALMKMQEYSAKHDRDSFDSMSAQFLKDFDETKIIGLLHTLADFSSGQNFHISIYEAAYKYSYGQVPLMTSIGVFLTNNFNMALAALALWKRMDWQARHKGEDLPDERRTAILSEIGDDHDAALKAMVTQFKTYVAKCENEYQANLNAYLDTRFGEVPVNPGDNAGCAAAAKAVYDGLAGQFSWIAFSLLVYAPRGSLAHPDWMQQAFTGANYIFRPSQPFQGGALATVMVHWRDREDTDISGYKRESGTRDDNHDSKPDGGKVTILPVLDAVSQTAPANNPQDQIKAIEKDFLPKFPGGLVVMVDGGVPYGTAGDDSPYSKEVAQAVGITSMPMLRQPVYTVEPQSAPEPVAVIGFGPVWENLVLNRFRVFFLDTIYVL